MNIKLTKEAKIGIVTIVSLILLYVGINYLKGINLFKPSNHYLVSFHNVKDVTISSPVFVEGFKVGLVGGISYDYSTTDKITVDITLDEKMRINKGSYVTIVKSLLGGAELHIHLNKYVSEFLNSGDTLEGRLANDMLGSIQDDLMPAVMGLMPKIDSILVGLQAIVNNPAINQSLNHIERATTNLEVSTRSLNSLLSDDVPVLVNDLKHITGNFSEVSDNLRRLDLATTVNTLNLTLGNLKLTTDKLNSKDNTFGLLLNDKALYNNLNSATDNASKLLLDLKQNPKRYVHFSVF